MKEKVYKSYTCYDVLFEESGTNQNTGGIFIGSHQEDIHIVALSECIYSKYRFCILYKNISRAMK